MARWPGQGSRWCYGCGCIWRRQHRNDPPAYKDCRCEWPQVFDAGVQIHGDVKLGRGVQIAEPSEINGTGAEVIVGDGCDIAAHVALNVADSSDRCLGRSEEIARAPIVLGHNVFVGSHCFIGGGVTIGHHSKVAAGTIIREPLTVPPYSLVKMGLVWTVNGYDPQSAEFGVVVVAGVYAP